MFNFFKKCECKNENLYRTVVEATRSSLDLNKTIKTIIDVLGKALTADRCFIMEYDKENNNFKKNQEEYLSSLNIRSYIGVDLNEHIPHFVSEFKKGKRLIYNTLKTEFDNKEVDLEDGSFEKEKIAIKEYKVYSALVFPLHHVDEFLGDLVIHYVDKKHKAGEEEINLVSTVASQIAIALYQARLFEQTKEQLERENLLRTIIEEIRSSIDINQVKTNIVSEVGKALNANMCFIMSYNREEKFFFVDKYSEYRSSNKEKSFIDFDFTNDNVKWFMDVFKSRKEVDYVNIEEFLTENNLQNTSVATFLNSYNLKSAYNFPIFYANKLLGYLVVKYTNDYTLLKEEDFELLRNIAIQSGVALYQSELYQKEKHTAEGELLLRRIIDKFRKTLDVNEIKQTIVNEVGRTLDANICFIMNYNHEDDYFYVDKYSEYRSSNLEKDFIDFDLRDPILTWFMSTFKSNKEIDYENIDAFLVKNGLQNSSLSEFLKSYNLKSAYNLPIFYANGLLGYLVVKYTHNYKKLNENDLDFLRDIAIQAGNALRQAKLHEITKATAEREALLRKITIKIRRSLDIKETLSYICEEMAKVFNVQRSTIVFFSGKDKYNEIILREEYKSNPEIKGSLAVSDFQGLASYWGENLIEMGQILALDNIDESDVPEYFKKGYKEIGVKSIIGTIVKSKENELGILVLSEYLKCRHWSDEEKDLLKTIADQIYLAISQAELYECQKDLAKRERINRNIIEILRSSMDKAIIKKLFVKNIGKLFDADRVFFSEYDPKEKMYLPVDSDSEYLSSDNEKSFVGYDWSNPDIKEHVQPLLEKREINIFNWDDYIKQNPNKSEDFVSFYLNAEVKSSYNFPVLHENEIIGYFCIEFTRRVCELSDEDINRIRGICTQTGIALYQAHLYTKSQKYLKSKRDFIDNIAKRIEVILKKAVTLFSSMTKAEVHCERHNEFLKNIENINQLLESISNLIEIKNIEDESI